MDHPKLLLNLGCGSNFHPEWRNLDLVPQSREVEQVDLSQGIPFSDDEADVVYHSHVLEHLTPLDATTFIAECFRVLKPGGILRIVVPDLEEIARCYLKSLEQAWEEPTKIALANHRWMQLELLDQLLRKESGGEMGKYMISPEIPNREFVDSRLGNEVSNAQGNPADENAKGNVESVPSQKTSFWQRTKTKWKRKLIRLLYGKDTLQQLDVAEFRQSGEIHQWMYDRVSLRNLLEKQGFQAVRICEWQESSIDDFARYELDFKNGQALKPDSIFVEAVKPAAASKNAPGQAAA